MRLKGVSGIRADRRDAGRIKKGLPEERVGHYLYVSTATVYAKTNDLPVAEASPVLPHRARFERPGGLKPPRR
jgi:hypothetical protein